MIASTPRISFHSIRARVLTQLRSAAPTTVKLDETSEIGLLYGARTTPHMYIIDKTGQLVYMGGIDNIPSSDEADIAGAKNCVRAALDAFAAGKAIEDSVTVPCVCSVKYESGALLSRLVVIPACFWPGSSVFPSIKRRWMPALVRG